MPICACANAGGSWAWVALGGSVVGLGLLGLGTPGGSVFAVGGRGADCERPAAGADDCFCKPPEADCLSFGCRICEPPAAGADDCFCKPPEAGCFCFRHLGHIGRLLFGRSSVSSMLSGSNPKHSRNTTRVVFFLWRLVTQHLPNCTPPWVQPSLSS